MNTDSVNIEKRNNYKEKKTLFAIRTGGLFWPHDERIIMTKRSSSLKVHARSLVMI